MTNNGLLGRFKLTPAEKRLRNRARDAVHRALRSGRLIKPKWCAKCLLAGVVQAHHENYRKPLAVDWLCPPCHRLIHRPD